MPSNHARNQGVVVVFALMFASAGAAPAFAHDTFSLSSVRTLHEWLGDQCSFAPDLDVGDCCGEHDAAYEEGGNRRDRRTADRKLGRCIKSKGRPVVAGIYFIGVRAFGWAFFNWG